jgi:hypothetical protein
VKWLRFPGGLWIDGGPWVVPEMSMYSRTGQWEPKPIPQPASPGQSGSG